jgi:hypothetical protein
MLAMSTRFSRLTEKILANDLTGHACLWFWVFLHRWVPILAPPMNESEPFTFKKCFWFLSTSDPVILKNQKSYLRVKKMDVANDVSHICARYQCQILCILSYTKMTKSDKFFVEFCIVILHICRLHHQTCPGATDLHSFTFSKYCLLLSVWPN